MTREFLSLREIARRLNIPPSSVAYYKDRFSAHIPKHGAGGRRVRYPAEALAVFREIRQMFDRNWTSEQVEQELAASFGAAEPPGGGAGGLAGGVAAGVWRRGRRAGDDARPGARSDAAGAGMGGLGGLNAGLDGLLERMSGLLESQALFRAEIDGLRGELRALREERDRAVERGAEEVARLHGDLEAARRELDGLRSELDATRSERDGLAREREALCREREALLSERDELRAGAAGAAGGAASRAGAEPHALLGLPLVIFKDGGYLGVSGPKGHFCLRDFVGLLERRRSQGAEVVLRWSARGGSWELAVRATEGEQVRELELSVRETVTPSNNRVARLERMAVDGREAPDRYLLLLFRKIREEFES
ncbi:MAG: MerR family transcriptional regulator [Desulfovibrionaceae bacterium]|nr:MerR family transcriptional regulator [Desulfovibrionaceae bacterium]